MAVNDYGARFPCLAMSRYMVAMVVTLLAVVVIGMVITVDVLRPKEISVSVLRGHVNVTDLWNTTDNREAQVVQARAKAGGGDFGRNTTTKIVYKPANHVEFGLTLEADNPSGRANINCTNVTIRFHDMPYGGGNFTGMMQLDEIIIPNMSFVVKKSSSHMLMRWKSIGNMTVLSYLNRTYGGKRSFTGAVHVAISISSDTLVGWTSYRYVDHYCWPLDVSVDEPSYTAWDVTCVQRYGKPLF